MSVKAKGLWWEESPVPCKPGGYFVSCQYFGNLKKTFERKKKKQVQKYKVKNGKPNQVRNAFGPTCAPAYAHTHTRSKLCITQECKECLHHRP